MSATLSTLTLRCTAAGGASKGPHQQARSILVDASRLASLAPQHEDCI